MPALLQSYSTSTPAPLSHRPAPDVLLARASHSIAAPVLPPPDGFRRPQYRTFVAPHAPHTVPAQVATPIADVARRCLLRPDSALALPLRVAPERAPPETPRPLLHPPASTSCSGRYIDRHSHNHVDRCKRGSVFLITSDFGSTSYGRIHHNKRSPVAGPILRAALLHSSLDSNSAEAACGSSRTPPN